MAQLFVSGKGYVCIYPMRLQSEFPEALHCFCKEVGVPVTLFMDVHIAQKKKKTNNFCHQVGTMLHLLDEGTLWANRAELYIGLFKEAIIKYLRLSNAPMVFWDYFMDQRALLQNAILRPLFQNQGLAPHEATFGQQGDIYNICNFGWYQWVYYRNPGSFLEGKELLSRILVPCKNKGTEMLQDLLTGRGTIVPRRTIHQLKACEMNSETELKKRKLFNNLISSKLGYCMLNPPNVLPTDYIPYYDGNINPLSLREVYEDPVQADGTAVFEDP